MDNNLITQFLRKCADDISSGKASVKLNIDAINLYCSHTLNMPSTICEDDEIYKYLMMGWYIYRHIDQDQVSTPSKG